jgi:hypothetical protein
MKKTPFLSNDAPGGYKTPPYDGNLSSQPQKRSVALPVRCLVERGTDPRWCSARRMIVCRDGYGYLSIADCSANIRLQLPGIRGAVSLSRVEKKRYIVQSSSNPVGRKSDASIENSYLSNRDSDNTLFYLSIAYSIDPCNIAKLIFG